MLFKGKRKPGLLIIMIICCLLPWVTGCSSNSGSSSGGNIDKKNIVLAISPDVEKVVKCAIPSLEELGYELEIIVFDDFVQPNVALKEGTVDANFFQHQPYLDIYNDSQGTDLVMLDPKLIYSRWGLYSNTINSLDEIPNGAKIANSDDPSNMERGLLLLQNNGLITLSDEPIDKYYSVADIVENHRNIEIVPVGWFSVYQALHDVDLVIIAGYWVLENGGDPSTGFAFDYKPEYAMGITINPTNIDTQWAKDLIKAFTTTETKNSIDEIYKGSYGFCF